jgi:apolipoprotein N-acyltransferase
MLFKELSPGWNRFALVLIFASLLSLAFPPLQLGFLAYWALIPLFFMLKDLSPKKALFWGYLAGFFWNFATLYWIGWVTIPGLIGVLIVLPLYLMCYAWIHAYLRDSLGSRFIFLIPFVWVALEYVKSLGVLGFPWTSLAYTQTYYTRLIQFASVTGAFGVSFWIVWINVIIYYLIERKSNVRTAWPWILVLLLLFVIPLFYGMSVIPETGGKTGKENVRVALVQGNIDPYQKWDEGFLRRNFEIYDSLTVQLADDSVDLVVWPETATACYLRARYKYLYWTINLARRVRAPILTGTPDYRYVDRDRYETYNALMLIDPVSDVLQTYYKMHLVPFGERVPFEDSIPFLHDFLESLNMGTGDFSPGKELKLFSVRIKGQEIPVAGIICFESIFGDQVRRFVKAGSQLLVIVTNDAWFGNTSGPYQHAQIAVFRAVENRISIARCANTGISSFIDPYGRVRKKSRWNEAVVLVDALPLRTEKTFYTKHGDWIAYLVLAVTGGALAGAGAKQLFSS